MKKIYLLFLLILFVSMLCGCNFNKTENTAGGTIESTTENNGKSTTEDIFAKNDVSEYSYSNGDFEDYFTPKEYVDLCLDFQKKSFVPEIAINEDYFIVRKFIGSGDEDVSLSFEYLIVNVQGQIIRDYGDNSWVAVTPLKLGDFTFITLQRNPGKFELIDKNANAVSILDFHSNTGLSYVCDAEDGYHLFSAAYNGQFFVYILNPTGEYYNIPIIRNMFINYNDFSQSLEKGETKIGKASEGLFYFTYTLANSEHTSYFNSFGETIERNSDY